MASRLITIRESESIFIDFLKIGQDELEATMEASYILEDETGTAISTGALTKAVDNRTFELRVGSTETTGLTDADYLLLVKVFDTTTGYADFIFEEITRVYS